MSSDEELNEEFDEELAVCESTDSTHDRRKVTIKPTCDSAVECISTPRESARKGRPIKSSQESRSTYRNHQSTKSQASRSTYRTRLSDITSRNSRRYPGDVDEERRRLVPLLARRAYHLPGNSWCDDWMQYMTNNHPLLGMCFHHKYHPIKAHQRVVWLIGSIAFGLAATNMVFIYFYLDKNADADEPILQIHFNTNHTLIESNQHLQEYDSVTLTNGMVALWTVGGALHSIFDLTVWYITACACCHPGGTFGRIGWCRSLGSYAVIVVVSFTVAMATFLVVLRATIEQRQANEANGNLDNDDLPLTDWNGLKSLSFLIEYLVQMGLALFVYYPLFGTIFFSGILGCGRLPFLGGRPRDVRRQRAERYRRPYVSDDEMDTFDDETIEENTVNS